jgi:O-acetyl-ADP-ribose deacetylase (regulator of RNase III)
MDRDVVIEGRLELMKGDVTRADTDAVVNAANAMLIPGGGVDGALHRAAGPELQTAVRDIKLKLGGGTLRTGEAVITPGFALPARHVIHCVGPIYLRDGAQAAELLTHTYTRALELCSEHQLSSVSFPSISTGAYGYPVREAALIAVTTVKSWLSQHELPRLCRFVLFDDETFGAYRQAARAVP